MKATMCRRSILEHLVLFLALVYPSIGWSRFHSTSMEKDRSVIVQLFEWRFDDIADECKNFLGPYGYGGVQVSPVLEYAVIVNQVVVRPWWERYQPVSYKISSRSGDEGQLLAMIDTCNKAGVRVYIDFIGNHMTGGIAAGTGIGGSSYDSDRNDYPGVPYNNTHFNTKEKCGTGSGGIEHWDNPNEVRNCELTGLHDLDQGQEHVRAKIAEALNKLIDLGVAGFRMDATKHMWPGDLQVITHRLNRLNSTYFAPKSRPFLYHEVSYGGPTGVQPQDYNHLGRIVDFQFKDKIHNALKKRDNKNLKDLYYVGDDGLKAEDSLAIVDNHDLQRSSPDSIRFMGSYDLKLGTVFMLAWPYGLPKVMSSYNWGEYLNEKGEDVNNWEGPPHDDQYNIKRVTFNSSDLSCGDGWVCEHRWREIYNMVRFRNVVGLEPVENWWDNGSDQIAFSRGRKGFVAINNRQEPLTQRLRTGLPGGTYCDVISGNIEGNKCSGIQVAVGSDGLADIDVENGLNPIIAIHIGAKLK